MNYEIVCSVCGKSSCDLLNFRCPYCGQPLDVRINVRFETAKILKKDFSAWRYRATFPYVQGEQVASLGEGWTPLVRFSGDLFFKLESMNPTGSFKDRGSTVLISAISNVVRKAGACVSEDSSGNAGASIAAYAARAGLHANIFVPQAVSGPKLNQIMAYGAEVVKVSGSRSRVAEEAQKPAKGRIYVGHILHPMFRDGIRTLAYEIAEQCNYQLPERVYLPVSAGTLLLGVLNGFKHLAESGVTKHTPKVVACQTRQVSPLYHRFAGLNYSPPQEITSVADALVSVNPPLLDLMVKELKDAKGDAVMVEEEEIWKAFKELAQRGFFVEPSSAVAYAGYKRQIETEQISNDASAIVVLTGAGLKVAVHLHA